jgi:hypothetical protein
MLLEDANQPPAPTHSSCVDMVHNCTHVQAGERGGALLGEYAYTGCTTALVYINMYIYLATLLPAHRSTSTRRGLDLCLTLGGGYKKGTLRHPEVTCRGVGGQPAVSLKPLLRTSPTCSSYRCLSSCLFFRLPRWHQKLVRPTFLLPRFQFHMTPPLSIVRSLLLLIRSH